DGGTGDDDLTGGAGNDSLTGGAGADTLDGSAGSDTIWGDAGNDLIYANTLGDRGHGGADVDVFAVDYRSQTSALAVAIAGGSVTVNGTVVADGIEHLSGSFGTGNDTVNAGFFMANPEGEGGWLDGHQGSDLVVLDYSGTSPEGQTASQVYVHANGNGTIYLDDENYRTVSLSNFESASITGSTGDDYLQGASGASTLAGGDGDDTIEGQGGADVLDGGTGDDDLTGGAGNDSLTGGAGADTLDGSAGSDTIWGDAGNDLIYADTLGDRGHGGADVDVFAVDYRSQTSALAVAIAGGSVTVNGTVVADGIEYLSGTFGTGNDTVNAGFFMANP
ncbi:calcium-binding protein, partial [Cereibacter sphaeroides]|uniref:calcium-binding protein n=1 Tax=Cereibacter sphaeroides TaxID=1063 RepID=UPI002278C2D2